MTSIPERFPLLVFDWDGTIMDSIASIVACTYEALGDLGIEGPPADRIRASVGLGLRDVLARLWPDGTASDYERLVARYRFHWLTTYRHRSVPFAGTGEALRELAGRGHFLAVATGKGRTGLERDLESSGLDDVFLATRTVDEAPPKPSPKMLLDLHDELGVTAGQTLMIGDTTFDLEMARLAGSASVGVLTGHHSREELVAGGALACLDSVVDLPAWLERNEASPP